MKYLLFVALGGAAGAVSRHLLAAWAYEHWDSAMPWGTFLINMLGSFGIGLFYVLIVEKQLVHPDWRGVVMVGFLGAFTTFSTYSLEAIGLLESGHGVQAAAYVLASAVLCVFAAALAMQLARFLL